MNIISHYLKPLRKKLAFSLTTKTIGTLMDLLIPWILSYIIDKVIPSQNIKNVILWGLAMALCAALAFFTNVFANRTAAYVAKETTKGIRYDLFEKISYLSNSEVDRFTIPTIISRMTTDTYTVHQIVGTMQRMGIRAPLLLVGGIIVTLFLDPVLALSMIAVLPFAALLTIFVSKKGVKIYRKIQLAVDNMVRVVRENITGVRVIKALSKADHERERFNKVNENLTKREKNASLLMGAINPIMSFIMNAGFVIVIVIGAHRVDVGTSEIGKIIAFMTYFTLILGALMSVTRIFTMTSKAAASLDRIKEILDAPKETDYYPIEEGAKNTEEDMSDDISHIEFKNVVFNYENSKFTMDNISFDIPRYGTLGIIGATGSGKSTLAQLLMRFYDINEGQILINNKDIRYMSLYELRSRFGLVFQNDTLFKNTIKENIDLGRNIDLIEMKKAATNAQAENFIQEAGGFEAEVAIKGMNFSGGQRQRLLLTRALASNPEILILDDASSALDYKTDALLRQALKTHYKNSTKIIITQRISSIMQADKILVLDKGKVIGYGSHKELLEKSNIYKEISQSQLGGSISAR